MIPVDKLQTVVRRRSEIDDLMCEPKVIADSARIQALSRERSQILRKKAKLQLAPQPESIPFNG